MNSIIIQKVQTYDSSVDGIPNVLYIDGVTAYLWDTNSNSYVPVTNAEPATPSDPVPLTFVQAATVGILSYNPVYNNSAGTLTATQNGILRDTSTANKIDTSYSPVAGDFVLVKNQVDAKHNGIYEITNTGTSSAPYVLTRPTNFNESAELYPLQINVLQGSGNIYKYFLQTTSNPVIGVSNLVFALSSTQSITTQIAFVDTVIDTPLSNMVYANGVQYPSIPGTGATLTATVNGALGIWNGLTANTNSTVANSFTRVLLMNQTNSAYNGDYQVINAGSSTTKWVLRRINSGASSFDRYTRYFVVSNTGSTKAGKVYFTTPNSPPLTNATIGTSPINIVEFGGASLGPIGIANTSGVYTYYTTLTLAMNAATSGQTIELFSDITETGNVSINLKDGVNINGNGHTYTLNSSSTANCIQDNGSAVNCSISNIIFKRLGGTASSTNTLCMYITGASIIKAIGTKLIGGATSMRCLTINNASAQVFGIYAEGYNPTITVTNGQLLDSTSKSFNGQGIYVEANGTAISCIGYGNNSAGIFSAGKILKCVGIDSGLIGINSTGGVIQDCTGYGMGGAGIYINSVTTVTTNSTGYSTAGVGVLSASPYTFGVKGYSTASFGIYLINGVLVNCLGFSTANYGIYMENSGNTISELRSCQAISTASAAIYQNNTIHNSKIIKTEAICRWNNASGHAIRLVGNNTQIVQCVCEVTNNSGNGIYAASALNAKIAHTAFIGSNTAIHANVTQTEANLQDLQGNILI